MVYYIRLVVLLYIYATGVDKDRKHAKYHTTMVKWFYEVQDAGKLYLNSVTVSLDTALAGAHISLNCKHISFPRS